MKLWTDAVVAAPPAGWSRHEGRWWPPGALPPVPLPSVAPDAGAARRVVLRRLGRLVARFGGLVVLVVVGIVAPTLPVEAPVAPQPSSLRLVELVVPDDRLTTSSPPAPQGIPAGDTYQVGDGPVGYGLWRSEATASGCVWEIRRWTQSGARVVGTDQVDGGEGLVYLEPVEADTFWSTAECGSWLPAVVRSRWQIISDGDWLFDELAPGWWEPLGDCYVEQVVTWRGAQLDDTIAINPEGILVDEATDGAGLRIRNCPAGFALTDPAASGASQ